MSLKPGIYYDVKPEDYQADPAPVPSLSASIAKILINESPLHAWQAHPKLNPGFIREEKQIFDLGTVAHAFLLQGLSVGVPLPYEDWRGKDARIARDVLRADGKIPILQKHWDRVQEMVTAAHFQLAKHREASDAFTLGHAEVTICWTDDHGVVCRGRIDWLMNSHKRFFDYKSTGMTANPEVLSRSMFSAGWDFQEAFYRRGLQKLGYDAQGIFVAQEDRPPYALSAIGFNPLIMRVADGKVQRAIDLWAKCLRENKWPGYADRICYPEMPKWMETMEMEKELERV